ncbi:MAG TPA: hypothetical protein VLS47_01005 [Gallionella sp.]|nr:hypothetical protein [Gallionella sp.]
MMEAEKKSGFVIPAQAGIQRFYSIWFLVLSPRCGEFYSLAGFPPARE